MQTRRDASPVRAALALAVCTAALSACGGARAGSPGPSDGRGIEAAELPFRVLRARGGQEIGWEAFLAEVGKAGAVCLGENHRNPHDHWAQLHVFEQLSARNGKAGVATALGMEMFQRPFQGVLDDFSARRIDEAALLSRSGWKDRWGFDWSLYRPMVLLARDRGVALVALNIQRELTKKVSRRGIDKLDPAERSALPELVLDDAQHRAWWNAIMEEMGGAHGHSGSDDEEASDEAESGDKGEEEEKDAESDEDKAAAERVYTAQVLWDESMADTASRWLSAGQAGSARRQMIILAGNGHCHESAIVRRLERRGIATAVSVRPIIDDGEGGVAALLADPENDYLFVMTPARK